MATKEKVTSAENEVDIDEIDLSFKDDDDSYTTQIKATKKEKRQFDRIVSSMGVSQKDAFSALLDLYDGKIQDVDRVIDVTRFKEYLNSALQMFVSSVRYGESAAKLAEDKVRQTILDQSERIRELEGLVDTLQQAADQAKVTEAKLADARRQIENLTIQVETFRQINDDLQQKAGNIALFRELEDKAREQEKQIAVLEKEKEMKDEIIAVLQSQHYQTGPEGQEKEL